MLKCVSCLTVISLLSVACADNILDMKPTLYETLRTQVADPIRLGSSASSVKWGSCDSQKVYDVATGTNQPDPPNVGSNIDLNLDVIFNAAANIQGIHVSVAFTAQGATGPIDLYSQDSPAT